jgi:glutamate-ammonia-ligase adenylyltransferase
MREKVRAARPVPAGLFDVKHSPGGMMDAEFAVQLLVLAHGAQHRELLDNAGNIALLQRAAGLRAAARRAPGRRRPTAYRELRRAQHRARAGRAAHAVRPRRGGRRPPPLASQ